VQILRHRHRSEMRSNSTDHLGPGTVGLCDVRGDSVTVTTSRAIGTRTRKYDYRRSGSGRKTMTTRRCALLLTGDGVTAGCVRCQHETAEVVNVGPTRNEQ